MTVILHRIDARLRLGQHRVVLGELAGLVAANPVDVGLCERFMVALFRSGHRSRTLDDDLARLRADPALEVING